MEIIREIEQPVCRCDVRPNRQPNRQIRRTFEVIRPSRSADEIQRHRSRRCARRVGELRRRTRPDVDDADNASRTAAATIADRVTKLVGDACAVRVSNRTGIRRQDDSVGCRQVDRGGTLAIRE